MWVKFHYVNQFGDGFSSSKPKKTHKPKKQLTKKQYMEKFWHMPNFVTAGDTAANLVLHLAALGNWIRLLSLLAHEKVLCW